MADPRYEKVGTPDVIVMEECAELIKAICKARRFGWSDYHPDRPGTTNEAEVESEMRDVEVAILRLRGKLAKAAEKEKRAW